MKYANKNQTTRSRVVSFAIPLVFFKTPIVYNLMHRCKDSPLVGVAS